MLRRLWARRETIAELWLKVLKKIEYLEELGFENNIKVDLNEIGQESAVRFHLNVVGVRG